MKKPKVKVERWDTKPCTVTARQIMRMECGLAFASYQLGEQRIEKTGVREISKYDIVSGLQTAAAMAKKNLIDGDLDPRARSYLKKAFTATTRVLNVVRNGPEKIKLRDVPDLRMKVATAENSLREAWRKVRAHCRA